MKESFEKGFVAFPFLSLQAFVWLGTRSEVYDENNSIGERVCGARNGYTFGLDLGDDWNGVSMCICTGPSTWPKSRHIDFRNAPVKCSEDTDTGLFAVCQRKS
jgi:hypothetical protein